MGLFENISSISGVMAGIVLAVGYVVYFVQSVRHEIEPNPTTWLMWAYGTTLLTIIEADLEAPPVLLVLPITCSLCGIGVALLCVRRGKVKWPRGPDMYAFYIDLFLTFIYMTAWAITLAGGVSHVVLGIATMSLLVATNMSTIVSFVPIVRSTYKDPQHEQPLPWFVWTTSYALLGLSSFYATAGVERVVLMLYPISCFVLHGMVGILALRSKLLVAYQVAKEL